MHTISDDTGGCRAASPVSVLPTVSLYAYLKSVRNPHGLTRTIGEFRMLGYRAGNSAVVFEIECSGGRRRMLKCYTKPNPNLERIYGRRLLRGELFVYADTEHGIWTDAVIADWIDGSTLGECLRRAARAGDTATLHALSAAFDRMALRMLADPRAHGDLKPDNIIVAPSGRLHLIDFDAAYLPSMHGECSPELGTAAWQHPSRTHCDFDRHIDDYPIAAISATLHALAEDPTMFERFADADEALFPAADAVAGRCEALDHAERLFARRCLPAEYRIARLLRAGAYILPQIEEYLTWACRKPSDTERTPELAAHGGLWGYRCPDEWVVPPLFDSGFEFRGPTAEVVLGGATHRISRNGMPVKVDY